MFAIADQAIVTVEVEPLQGSGRAHVTIRRASGATRFEVFLDVDPLTSAEQGTSAMLPEQVWLQIHAQTPMLQSDSTPSVLSLGGHGKKNAALLRALGVLDRTLPFETQKIGVLYDDGDFAGSKDILGFCSSDCSPRYLKFLRQLGSMRRISDLLSSGAYTAGLEAVEETSQDSVDGEFALIFSG
jgi:hypothetical protein